MNKKIESLFKIRDEAVSKKDKKLFLSTQIKEIDGSSSKGYLDTDRMKTTILHVHRAESESNVWIAFVREDFFQSDKLTHHGYLLYTVVDRKGELIISNIRW